MVVTQVVAPHLMAFVGLGHPGRILGHGTNGEGQSWTHAGNAAPRPAVLPETSTPVAEPNLRIRKGNVSFVRKLIPTYTCP